MAIDTTTCQKCGSNRMADISGKCSDMSDFSIPSQGIEKDGYVPSDAGIGGGDYIEIGYCMDCGQMEGEWPLPKTEFEEDNEAEAGVGDNDHEEDDD